MSDSDKENKGMDLPPEVLEYIKKKIEEDRKKEEKKEREKALQELKKYVPHLIDVPDDAEPRHIRAIAAFLSKCRYKPREQRPSLIADMKKNLTLWILLGAIAIVGVLGVIF